LSTISFALFCQFAKIIFLLSQIIAAWERIRISDILLRVELTGKIVQNICKIAEYYVDRILAQLASDGFCGELQVFIPEALLIMFCAAINNAEQVRRSLMFHSKLHLDEITVLYSKNPKYNQEWKVAVERNLDECDQYIGEQIAATIRRLIRRLAEQMKKHIFHLAWSPSACAIETAIKPLIDMLDGELSKVHRILLHKNFSRVMLEQLKAIFPLLKECVQENPGLDPVFYGRLSEACTTLELLSVLALNQTSTRKLIEQYYKDLLQEQDDVTECKYGILNVRAYYNIKSKTLVIDVIGAKQLIPLDTNGLSDPFVVIELVPRIFYQAQPVVKTRIVNKSLNPIFDETFEFHIPNEISPSAMVHFTVMDHDFLRSNDYAGEAFLELADIPGFSSTAGSTLKQFNLILIHPSKKENAPIEILSSRKDDKIAQEFVKILNTAY
uniref:C2 domain-containing protein n=1 Tax=Dracunculus medinensis TaxID=318479 RepID=A0A158Q3A8_DRAME